MRGPTRSRAPRAGFTMIEVMIAAVVGLVILGAVYQVLIINQRVFTVEQERIRVQQTVRAGMDALIGELRGIEAAAGDLIAMGPDSVSVRTLRGFGLVCAPASGTDLLLERGERPFRRGDSVLVYAENDPFSGADDDWIRGEVAAVDTTVACPGGGDGQSLSLPGTLALSTQVVRPGAPVRSFVGYTYGLFLVRQGWFLARRTRGGRVEPLVGPLAPPERGGLHFEFRDSLGLTVADPGSVTHIEVRLRSESSVTQSDGKQVSDSLAFVLSTRS